MWRYLATVGAVGKHSVSGDQQWPFDHIALQIRFIPMRVCFNLTVVIDT